MDLLRRLCVCVTCASIAFAYDSVKGVYQTIQNVSQCDTRTHIAS